ncbi:hypothetical protein bsdtb5_35070 [Anaeromicropila herbilytica]|uniref:Uncharacterized protein n=1 Tax=Anaeromicropila herbilytica TaxID=2785025 RepID=A0A7R7IE36_9FIRM|nr:hypothetical protein bsdtb5_35070 [Anaeromicropila herbilytica]
MGSESNSLKHGVIIEILSILNPHLNYYFIYYKCILDHLSNIYENTDIILGSRAPLKDCFQFTI